MDENTKFFNIDIKLAGDFNQLVNQIGSVFYVVPKLGDYLIGRFYHKAMFIQQTEQDKIAMSKGLAYYDYTKKQIAYFENIDDPKLKIEAHKEADREQQQVKLFDCVLEELENKNLSLEHLVIDKDTDTNYFNEEFFHHWDKYSDDMRRDDLRKRWAKILIQEMKNPHTISIRTMEFVKTLSTRDANIFNMILPYVISNDTIPHIYNIIHFIDLQHLEHLGLLLGNRNVTLGSGTVVSLGKQALKCDKFQFSSYSLSDIGKELYLITDVGEYDWDILAEAFDNDKLVKEGDIMTFHKMLNETLCEPTPFRIYQKASPKNDIRQKYAHLHQKSQDPNI